MGDKADNWFTPPNPNLDYEKLYQPLATEKEQIRLLKLLPGEKDRPIHCELIPNVDLNLARNSSFERSFEALSYCAGKTSDYCAILFNGLQFNAFISLRAALEALRLKDRERILWVDQICINQTDIEERNAQVAMMVKIYETASKVQIWLGEESTDGGSKAIFGLVSAFWKFHGHTIENAVRKKASENCSLGQACRKWLAAYFANVGADHLPFYDDAGPAYKFMAQIWQRPESRPLLTALESFFCRPYWTRCWIVQEVAVSSDANILCGLDTCGLHEFFVAMVFAMSIPRAILYKFPGKRTPDVPADIRAILKAWTFHAHCICLLWSGYPDRRHHLINLLGLTDSFSASDPRDRLYSVLGILDEKTRQELNVLIDYSSQNTVQAVVVHFATAWIKSGSGLFVLGRVHGDEPEHGLPSWAPDFSRSGSRYTRGIFNHVHEADWKACGPTSVDYKFLGNDRLLGLEGVFVGRITNATLIGAADNSNGRSDYDGHWDVVQSWRALTLTKFPDANSSPWYDFWRTIGMDRYEKVRTEKSSELWEQRYLEAMASEPLSNYTSNRTFCILPGSLMGLFPKEIQIDDLVVIFAGGHVPFVVRPRKDIPICRLIGECYVHGIMYGAFMRYYMDSGKEFLTFWMG